MHWQSRIVFWGEVTEDLGCVFTRVSSQRLSLSSLCALLSAPTGKRGHSQLSRLSISTWVLITPLISSGCHFSVEEFSDLA